MQFKIFNCSHHAFSFRKLFERDSAQNLPDTLRAVQQHSETLSNALQSFEHNFKNLSDALQCFQRQLNILTDRIDLAARSILLERRKHSETIPLTQAEFRVFSQFGDDGIIQYIITKLNLPLAEKRFVEFGVKDYRESNTRFLLLNDNWSGLVMDGSEKYVSSNSSRSHSLEI